MKSIYSEKARHKEAYLVSEKTDYRHPSNAQYRTRRLYVYA